MALGKRHSCVFLLTLALLFIVSGARLSSAQTQWQKYEGNPVLEPGPPGQWDEEAVGDPVVIKVGSVYKMWYGSDSEDQVSQEIGYATSSDGIIWTKYAENPVLSSGLSGSWDDSGIGEHAVLLDGDIYKMWYTGDDGVFIRIGYATSSDGIIWTKYAENPVLSPGEPGQWDDGSVNEACVLKDGDTYKMWYVGENGVSERIGYATSSDGIIWTKYANPVLSPGEPGAWDEDSVDNPSVVLDAGVYHMWYEGESGDSSMIGYATSPDGLDWTRYAANPVLEGDPPESWAEDIGQPSVMKDGAVYKMWYAGQDKDHTIRVGYALPEAPQALQLVFALTTVAFLARRRRDAESKRAL